jgi:hypothetical protein
MSGEETTEEEPFDSLRPLAGLRPPFNVQDLRALYVRRGTKHWPVFSELLMDGSLRLAADLLGVATSSTGALPQLSGIAKHIEGFPRATMPGEYLRSINSGGSEVAALIR